MTGWGQGPLALGGLCAWVRVSLESRGLSV